MNGVQILSVLENLDGSPEGLMLESVLEGMNQYFSVNLARETLKGLKEVAHQCRNTGGIPPLGYNIDKDTKKYVINEQEAKIVRIIFEKYADGLGYTRILQYLNSKGYTTKSHTTKDGRVLYGKPFGKNSLYSILRNQKYTGKFIYNQYQVKDIARKKNAKMKPKEEWVIVDGGVPDIISPELFDKVQNIIQKNSYNGGRHKAKEVYLLSGLLFCGECGAGTYGNSRCDGHTKNSKYVSYRCSNNAQHKGCHNKEIRREHLENYVLEELYNKLFTETSIQKLLSMLTEYNNRKAIESNEDLIAANNELTEVMRKISAVIRLVSESGIEISTVKGELKQLEDRKHCLEAFIEELTLNNAHSMISEEMLYNLII